MDYKNKGRKTAILFLIFSLLLQMIFCLFFTCSALEKVFPFYAYVVSNPVSPDDNSYTEYYPIRRRIVEKMPEIIVIGVDFQYEETYPLLLDLIKSLKNDVNIGTFMVNAYDGTMETISEFITAENEEERIAYQESLAELVQGNDAFLLFLSELNEMKDTYPPQRQFTGGTFVESSDEITEEEITEEVSASRRIIDTLSENYSETGRPVLLITDEKDLHIRSVFREELENRGADVMSIRFHYEETNGIFPGEQYQIRLMDSQDLQLFDDIYANAAKKAEGQYPSHRFSELYSTDVSIHLYNCKRSGENAEENP